MGKQYLSRTTCLRHNLLIIACKSYKSGLKLSVSKIPGYYLQWWLCCSSSKIGIFSIFGGVKCALGDSVHHVIRDVSLQAYTTSNSTFHGQEPVQNRSLLRLRIPLFTVENQFKSLHQFQIPPFQKAKNQFKSLHGLRELV